LKSIAVDVVFMVEVDMVFMVEVDMVFMVSYRVREMIYGEFSFRRFHIGYEK